jgi:hypothetical protein
VAVYGVRASQIAMLPRFEQAIREVACEQDEDYRSSESLTGLTESSLCEVRLSSSDPP